MSRQLFAYRKTMDQRRSPILCFTAKSGLTFERATGEMINNDAYQEKPTKKTLVDYLIVVALWDDQSEETRGESKRTDSIYIR